MRVLCIDENPPGTHFNSPWPKLVKEGEVYEVVKDHIVNNHLYYFLSIQPEVGYLHSMFIPLSDKDETTYSEHVLETIFQPKHC